MKKIDKPCYTLVVALFIFLIFVTKIFANEKIVNFIEENYTEDMNYFKNKNKIEINIFLNNSLGFSDYIIEFFSITNSP